MADVTATPSAVRAGVGASGATAPDSVAPSTAKRRERDWDSLHARSTKKYVCACMWRVGRKRVLATSLVHCPVCHRTGDISTLR